MVDLGPTRLAISNGLTALMKELYGKGPVAARTFLDEEFVFTVLEGGLTRSEERLLEAGGHDLIRRYRLAFQEAVRDEFTAVVERATGKRVRSYHSQILFEPPHSIEMFRLESSPLDAG